MTLFMFYWFWADKAILVRELWFIWHHVGDERLDWFFKKKIFVKNVFAKYFLSAVRSFAIYFENGIIMGHLTWKLT